MASFRCSYICMNRNSRFLPFGVAWLCSAILFYISIFVLCRILNNFKITLLDYDIGKRVKLVHYVSSIKFDSDSLAFIRSPIGVFVLVLSHSMFLAYISGFRLTVNLGHLSWIVGIGIAVDTWLFQSWKFWGICILCVCHFFFYIVIV